MVWRSDRPEPVFQTKRAVVPVVEREFEALRSADAESCPLVAGFKLCIESVYPRYSDPSAGWLLVCQTTPVWGGAPRRALSEKAACGRLRRGEVWCELGRMG